jgi:ATP-dependent helicase HrpB
MTLAALSPAELAAALAARLPPSLARRLDAEAPTHFTAPTGTRVPIDYQAEAGPKIAVRVQELFGLDRHPTIARGTIPLTIELLSPAQRPVQTTRDLPGFWRGSYAAVRAAMRPPFLSAMAMNPRSWAKTSTSLDGGTATTILNFRGR